MDFDKMRDLNSKEKILKVKFKDGTETETITHDLKMEGGFLFIRSLCEDPETGSIYWVEQAMNTSEIATFMIIREYNKNER